MTNPLSGRHINLPSLRTLDTSSENWLGFNHGVNHVIISCSPDSEDCRALMHYFGNHKIAFCCPNRSTEWTQLGSRTFDFSWNHHFTYSAKQSIFICLKCNNQLDAWNLQDPQFPKKTNLLPRCPIVENEEDRPIQKAKCFLKQYLVALDGSDHELLLVRRYADFVRFDGSYLNEEESDPDDFDDSKYDYLHYQLGVDDNCVLFENCFPHNTYVFDVNIYDPKTGTFRYLDDLDGFALFVGVSDSFALSPTDFPELKPNSIYFTGLQKYSFRTCDRNFDGYDVGIFDYENKTFSPCYYPIDIPSMKKIAPNPVWFDPSP